MKVPQAISDLLQKPMDRKEFLKHVGVASLFVAGAGILVKSMSDLGGASDSGKLAQNATKTYGSSVYGG